MKVANIVPSSLVNGDGIRMVIVFSGCSLNCKGCFSKELQDENYGKEVSPDNLVHIIEKNLEEYPIIDGLTLSGGNPQEQEELNDFLKILKYRLPKLNIWMWSGFTWNEIQENPIFKEHLDYIDVIITGRYDESLKCESEYYGSSNQKIWRKDKNAWKSS